ncbi:hypothetical protein [Pseudarthrobacter sp. NPDC080039]|uniref:hypothetical protein n=1 Tax=unclassified Pseudarthrobacter TaxID=2647000 RepID=UPI00344E1F19
MVLNTPYGRMLNYSLPSIEDQDYHEGASDPRLPATTNAVPTPRTDALRVMHLTDPNGVPVTFLVGESLPTWALPYR